MAHGTGKVWTSVDYVSNPEHPQYGKFGVMVMDKTSAIVHREFFSTSGEATARAQEIQEKREW